MFDSAQRATARRRLEALVARRAAARRRVTGDPALGACVRALEAYQARRLALTHADLHGDERYRLAVDFFLEDLYGPQDLSERDAQMVRALDKLARFLPLAGLSALAHAFELHVVTVELDAATAARLAGPAVPDDRAYALAYRATGRRGDRERQIELLGVVGELLDSVAHRPEVGLMVRLARAPAHAAGFGHLQEFLERGYQAFRAMRGADRFLEIVIGRERALLQRLFG